MRAFPFDEIDKLYGSAILDHYRRPRNRKSVAQANVEYDEFNPICGDRVFLQLRVAGDRIQDAGFGGEGCSISQASASMMTEVIKGRSLDEAQAMGSAFRGIMDGDTGPTQVDEAALQELKALSAVRKYPVRIKCALLAWNALEQGMEEHRVRESSC